MKLQKIFFEENGFTKVSNNIFRYARSWGSSISRDVSIYKYIINSNSYSEVLIQLLDVWPRKQDMPSKFRNPEIDERIISMDEVGKRYSFYDDLITNYILIKEF